MKKAVFLSILGSAALVAPYARGQSGGPDIINSSGGYAVVSGRTFEWSIAEMVVTTEAGSSLVITQGLLQPIDSALSAPVASIPSSQLSVFPNPTASVVNISFNAPAEGRLSYRVTDVTGKLLMEDDAAIRPGNTLRQLDLGKLANASYVLQVFYAAGDKAPASSTYKIQKIN